MSQLAETNVSKIRGDETASPVSTFYFSLLSLLLWIILSS